MKSFELYLKEAGGYLCDGKSGRQCWNECRLQPCFRAHTLTLADERCNNEVHRGHGVKDLGVWYGFAQLQAAFLCISCYTFSRDKEGGTKCPWKPLQPRRDCCCQLPISFPFLWTNRTWILVLSVTLPNYLKEREKKKIRERERTLRSHPCLPCSWGLAMWLGSDQWDRGRALREGTPLPRPLLPSSFCSFTFAMLQGAAAILPPWGGSRKIGSGFEGSDVIELPYKPLQGQKNLTSSSLGLLAALIIKLTWDRVTEKDKFNFVHSGATKLWDSWAVEASMPSWAEEWASGLALQRGGRGFTEG